MRSGGHDEIGIFINEAWDVEQVFGQFPRIFEILGNVIFDRFSFGRY